SFFSTGGAVTNGFFRVLLSMQFDLGRDSPRNSQLAMACFHFRIHDTLGLCGGMDSFSSWYAVRHMTMGSWQTWASVIAAVSASAYLLARGWRTWQTGTARGCDRSCGCQHKKDLPDALKMHARVQLRSGSKGR